jgi:hypothetical protein
MDFMLSYHNSRTILLVFINFMFVVYLAASSVLPYKKTFGTYLTLVPEMLPCTHVADLFWYAKYRCPFYVVREYGCVSA